MMLVYPAGKEAISQLTAVEGRKYNNQKYVLTMCIDKFLKPFKGLGAYS